MYDTLRCSVRTTATAWEYAIIRHGRNIYKDTSLASSIATNADTHCECIKHHVLSHQCNRIVIVANTGCKAIRHLVNDNHTSEFTANIRKELHRMINENYLDLLKENIKFKLLAEISAIKQCEALMGYDFIQKLVTDKQMIIHGIVFYSCPGKHIEVMRNGYRFNDSISMN